MRAKGTQIRPAQYGASSSQKHYRLSKANMDIQVFSMCKEISLSLRGPVFQNNLYRKSGIPWGKDTNSLQQRENIMDKKFLPRKVSFKGSILSFKKFSEVLKNSEILKQRYDKETCDL